MNKKFSTFVASLLLAGAVGTASAAISDKGAMSSYPVAIAKAIDGKFYQLSDGYQVLTMEKTAKGTYVLKFVPYGQAELAKTLWEIKATDSKDEKGLAFQFYNVSTGLPISIDVSKANVGENLTVVEMAQGVNTWSWMRGVEGDALLTPKAIESFFGAERDSVVTLINTPNGVAARKYATKDMASVASNLQVKPMEASPVRLNAYDLNTMLQTGKSKLHLTFTPNVSKDANVNEFTGADGKREFKVVPAVGENSLSIGSVADAKNDVADKQTNYDQLKEELSVAIENLVSLDGSFGEVKIKWEEAKQKHQDAVDTRDNAQQAYDDALANIGTYTEERGKYYSQYESALIISEAERKAWDDARNARIDAQNDRDAKREARDVVLAEYKKYEEERNAASAQETQLQTEATVKNAIYQGVEGVLRAAKGSKNDVKDEFIASLEDNAYFNWVKNSDPDAADELLEYLKEQNLANLEDATIEAYVRPYKKAFDDAFDAYGKAFRAKEEAQANLDECTPRYNVAFDAVLEAEKLFDKAYETEKAILAQWNNSTTEANEIWAKVEECDRQIAENEGKRDEAFKTLMDVTTLIPTLWADVEKYAEEFSKKGTAFGLAQMEVARLNGETFNAWELLNAAKSYLASIKNLANDWYSLEYSDGTHLMVDTAYIEENSSIKHQGFALSKFKAAEVAYPGIEKMTARDINGRFNFRFDYYPTKDSLVITADGGNDKPVNNVNWSDYRPIQKVNGRNYVKMAVLGTGANEHRELTLGAPYQIYTGFENPQQTLNTRISLGLLKNTPGIEVPAGLYHIDVVNTEDAQKNGARLMVDLDGSLTKVAPAEWDVMNFDHMPAAKWIVTGSTLFGDSPEIINQETTDLFNNGVYDVVSVENGVVTLEVSYFYQNGVREDIVKLTPAKSTADGYFNADTKNKYYTLNYLSVNDGLAISVGNSTVGKDTILRVSSEATKFDLELVKKYTYGQAYGDVKKLEKASYLIRVNDSYKFANNHKYVQVSDVDGTEMLVVVDGKENATPFFLKEVNDVDDHYYALIAGDKKAGVIDASGLIKAEDITAETTTSAFALNSVDVNLYREFTADELGKNGAMKFYRVNSTEKAYLYEGANSLLCVEGKGDNAAEAFNVISTGVKETIMPQYLIAKDVKFVEGTDDLCDICGKPDCDHSFSTKDTTFGRFLVNMIDSVPANKLYTWENKYSRLAFLPGYMTADTLFIEDTNKKVALSTLNKHDQTKFSFRLVSDESNDFLIESESWKNGNAFTGGIAPMEKGGWVKIQNGVPVIVSAEFETEAAQADVFNVEVTEGGATANDEITTSEVTIIAGEGNVTIANAAGKKVVVSNILGQVVATQVLTSDNAVIAAPQGVVVVAVEGEEAVKAIVR